MNKRERDSASHQEHSQLPHRGLGYSAAMWTRSSTFSPDFVPVSPKSEYSSSDSCLSYRPTSPALVISSGALDRDADGQYAPSFSIQYASCNCSPGPLPSTGRFPEDYHLILQRIEHSDPSLTHVVLHPIVNTLFGHAEWEFSHVPVFNDEEAAALARALSRNTCITSLDLSKLALGSQAVTLMHSVARLSTLTSLDFTENFISACDIARMFHDAAVVGMTQLQRLQLCEPRRLVISVPVIDVVTSAFRLPAVASM